MLCVLVLVLLLSFSWMLSFSCVRIGQSTHLSEVFADKRIKKKKCLLIHWIRVGLPLFVYTHMLKWNHFEREFQSSWKNAAKLIDFSGNSWNLVGKFLLFGIMNWLMIQKMQKIFNKSLLCSKITAMPLDVRQQRHHANTIANESNQKWTFSLFFLTKMPWNLSLHGSLHDFHNNFAIVFMNFMIFHWPMTANSAIFTK